MEETNQDIASAYEVGLIIGVNTPDEVVAWADAVVGHGEYPPAWVIPIALAQENDRLDLLKLLRVAPKPDSEIMRWCLVCESILGAFDRKTSSLRMVSSALSHCRIPEFADRDIRTIESRYVACDQDEDDCEVVNKLFIAHLQSVITDARTTDG